MDRVPHWNQRYFHAPGGLAIKAVTFSRTGENASCRQVLCE